MKVGESHSKIHPENIVLYQPKTKREIRLLKKKKMIHLNMIHFINDSFEFIYCIKHDTIVSTTM